MKRDPKNIGKSLCQRPPVSDEIQEHVYRTMLRYGIDKVTIAIAFLLLCAQLLIYISVTDASAPSHLTIGFTGSAFQDVSNTDIKAAVSMLIQKVAFKYFDKAESHYYENLTNMVADMRNGKVQVFTTPVEEFMELRKMIPLDPILATSSANGTEMELLLLTRKNSGIHSIWDLKGKSIVIPKRNPKYRTLFQIWLESMLYGKGYDTMEDFFSTVKEANTTSKAILPVFFRQAEACVVTRQVLNLTTEMNPQINRELAVIASKGKLAQGIIAVDRRLPEETKERMKQAFLTLHETPDGEQLLMLFKVKKLIPIPSGYLKGTEDLYAQCKKNKNRATR